MSKWFTAIPAIGGFHNYASDTFLNVIVNESVYATNIPAEIKTLRDFAKSLPIESNLKKTLVLPKIACLCKLVNFAPLDDEDKAYNDIDEGVRWKSQTAKQRLKVILDERDNSELDYLSPEQRLKDSAEELRKYIDSQRTLINQMYPNQTTQFAINSAAPENGADQRAINDATALATKK